MATPAPLLWTWDGEAMWPRPAFVRLANQQFVVGETYRLGEIEERSVSSHGHQFAWLKEAFRNLPERLTREYASPDHLRKAALIQTGYYRETILDVGTHEAAVGVAQALRSKDQFAWIVVRGHVVVMREAKSQSRRSMDKAEFQASKTAIMEHIAGLLGVTAAELEAAGRAEANA